MESAPGPPDLIQRRRIIAFPRCLGSPPSSPSQPLRRRRRRSPAWRERPPPFLSRVQSCPGALGFRFPLQFGRPVSSSSRRSPSAPPWPPAVFLQFAAVDENCCPGARAHVPLHLTSVSSSCRSGGSHAIVSEPKRVTAGPFFSDAVPGLPREFVANPRGEPHLLTLSVSFIA